jgi:hypothetical protein
MAGLRICASVKRPEPYFSSASVFARCRAPMPSAGCRACGVGAVSQKHVACGCRRRGLAIIDRDVFIALGRVNHHEAAAADVAGARISDGQRKAGGDRGIDGIAAFLENIGADLRSEPFLRDHHAVCGRNGTDGGEIGRRVEAALLCTRRRCVDERQHDCGECPAPSR